MTHVENVSHILKHGITHVSSVNSNSEFVSIGDARLILTRNAYKLENGKLLGEYIPFYFGVRTPMLYVIQKGYNFVASIDTQSIIYVVCSIQSILDLKLDFVFTDGHAIDKFSSLYYPSEIDKIESLIDRVALNAKYWKNENDLDLKRRKEAEFLVLGDIPFTVIISFVVYNNNAKNILLSQGVTEKMIIIKQDYYF